MPIYTVKMIGREEVAKDTMAFHFEKPEGFVYKAGQFGDYTLIDPPENDTEGSTRGFSLASAPYEPDLQFATRMRDTAFKRVMKRLPIGTQLKFDAPYGSFTLHRNPAIPAVFITGGIGSTVVRSILLAATHQGLAHRIWLFYANRHPEDAAFMSTFNTLAATNPHMRFIPTMTDTKHPDKAWTGETGHVTRAMLERYVADLTVPIYYCTSPAPLVAAMRTLLEGAGVEEDMIRTEEFTGY